MKRLGYVPSFDGVRAIAVFLVMLTHANFQLGDNGILGVDMFFALSGFLITTLLLEENANTGTVSLKAFYIRRFMRLFPALYLVLFAVLIYAIQYAPDNQRNPILTEVWASGLYISNFSWLWGWAKEAYLLGHTWSLAVEEQFYFIWPCILVVALYFRKIRLLNVLLIISIIACLVLKLTGNVSALGTSLLHESIFMGCAAALLRFHYGNVRIPVLLSTVCLVFIITIGILPMHWYLDLYKAGGRSLIGTVTAIILLGLADSKSDNFLTTSLSFSPFVFIGKISYSLYLWHVPVFKWFKWHSSLPPTVSFILKFMVTFILAIGSWYFLERHATALGHRLSSRIQRNPLKSPSAPKTITTTN